MIGPPPKNHHAFWRKCLSVQSGALVIGALTTLSLTGCPNAQRSEPEVRATEESSAAAVPNEGAPKQAPQPASGNTTIKSFRSAKKHAMKIVEDRRETFYCACTFSADKAVELRSCGYAWRKNEKRAQRVELEHIVPAEAFGKSFEVWREGHPKCVTKRGKPYKGRRCARKMSREFRLMEADLHNLQPAIGEVNGDRSNYSMDMIPGESRRYGACDVEIEERKIEPRPSIRGDIARIYLYMDKAYPGRGIVGKKRRRLMEAWDKSDPIDAWERTRNARIETIQGNANPFIR